MRRVVSFPPIERRDARVLILGTMPGVASLKAGQYYAHPRNAFWRILAELVGFDPSASYEHRVSALRGARIAVWDVLQSCHRQGSLDSDINPATLVPNAFAAFFAAHPALRQVCFNGAKAEALFARHVRPGLPADPRLGYVRLPSTSPAHAGMAYPDKVLLWRKGVGRI